MVYEYSSIELGRGSYRELVCTAYEQQQLGHNAARVLHVVATSQSLVLVLTCLVRSIMIFYCWEVTLCLASDMVS